MSNKPTEINFTLPVSGKKLEITKIDAQKKITGKDEADLKDAIYKNMQIDQNTGKYLITDMVEFFKGQRIQRNKLIKLIFDLDTDTMALADVDFLNTEITKLELLGGDAEKDKRNTVLVSKYGQSVLQLGDDSLDRLFKRMPKENMMTDDELIEYAEKLANSVVPKA